jgi:hypothetical protein
VAGEKCGWYKLFRGNIKSGIERMDLITQEIKNKAGGLFKNSIRYFQPVCYFIFPGIEVYWIFTSLNLIVCQK